MAQLNNETKTPHLYFSHHFTPLSNTDRQHFDGGKESKTDGHYPFVTFRQWKAMATCNPKCLYDRTALLVVK